MPRKVKYQRWKKDFFYVVILLVISLLLAIVNSYLSFFYFVFILVLHFLTKVKWTVYFTMASIIFMLSIFLFFFKKADLQLLNNMALEIFWLITIGTIIGFLVQNRST